MSGNVLYCNYCFKRTKITRSCVLFSNCKYYNRSKLLETKSSRNTSRIKRIIKYKMYPNYEQAILTITWYKKH